MNKLTRTLAAMLTAATLLTAVPATASPDSQASWAPDRRVTITTLDPGPRVIIDGPETVLREPGPSVIIDGPETSFGPGRSVLIDGPETSFGPDRSVLIDGPETSLDPGPWRKGKGTGSRSGR